MAERSKFDTVADRYATGRPDYPPALFDALAQILGRPLAGADAVDLGAGTGISSRQLAARGARVTAVELSRPMILRLAADSPGVRSVQGSAHAIPLRDACADLVTCAQAWHWIDPALGVPEVIRVLRPGGVFGAWWNHTLRDLPWERAQAARLDAAVGPWIRDYNVPEHFQTDYGLVPESRKFAWQRTVAVDVHLENLASKSYVAELPDPDAFLAAERAALLRVFPDGLVVERFTTELITVRTAGGPTAA